MSGSHPRRELRVLEHVKQKFGNGRVFTSSEVACALKLTPGDVGRVFAMNSPEVVRKTDGSTRSRALWVVA